MTTLHVYLVSESSSGGKFWEAMVDDRVLKTRYGKLGQDKKWSVKAFDSNEKAVNEANKKANSKKSKGYSEARVPVSIEHEPLTLNKDTPLVIESYIRAQERYPGGNADMFNLKWTIRTAGDDVSCEASMWWNYDGMHSHCKILVDEPLDKNACAEFLAMVRELTSQGERMNVCTILDERSDSEAYDTEWSWVEFLVSTEDQTPVLLFEQRALYATKNNPSPPNEAQQRLVASFLTSLGITRPEPFSDGKCLLRSRERWKYESVTEYQGGSRTSLPLYW